MNMRRVFYGMLLLPASLYAQSIATVRGTVTNEAGRGLEQAQVTLDPDAGSRQVRTDGEGRFSFLGVSPGAHTIRVLRVGFSPETRQVDVTSSGATVEIMLRRLSVLDTVAVTAKRTGLYGSVVSKDSLLPVPGARIEIIGARKADSTNSSGTFNLPDIKPGSYIVRVKHPLFESRNFSVVVPVGGGAELDVVVDRGRVSRDKHMEGLYREMDTRLVFRGINTAFVTREELKGRETQAVDVAVQYAPGFAKKAMLILSDVCVFVDGIARPGATLRDFNVEEIESVEFYGGVWRKILSGAQSEIQRMDPSGSLLDRWPPRAPCGQPLSPGEAKASKSNVKVMFALIWLRK